MEHKIKEDIDKKSIKVNKELSNGLVDIMNEYSDKINQQYEDNSFHHLFWNEQVKEHDKISQTLTLTPSDHLMVSSP